MCLSIYKITRIIYNILVIKYYNFYAEVESNPLVGSSKNNILGLATSYSPTETLYFCPPEIPLKKLPPILVSLCYSSPKS